MIPAELWRSEALDEGLLTAAWLARTLGRELRAERPAEGEAGELALPVETLLEAGGDARIVSSPESGMNRYGATSRPRPEAVHFSSSTASSVSDYAFAALDALRRALLVDALFRGLSLAQANERLAEAVRREILGMLTLSADEADVILAPSGTDTELLALIVALAAGPRLANILIAPEETGRAVKTAAAGLYFQEGASFAKGKRIWAAADIEVSSVAARDEAGRPFPLAAVDRAVGAMLEIGHGPAAARAAARADRLEDRHQRALAKVRRRKRRALRATSTSSPTPVSGAPPAKPWASGCARAGWRRFPAPSSLPDLRFAARSSFLLGCASGARPRLACGPRRPKFRRRAFGVLPGETPLTHSLDAGASFGPLLRWVGALIEATLFRQASLEVARTAFDAFCAEMRAHISACPHLIELEPPHFVENHASRRDFESFAGSSIICFAGLIDDGAGGCAASTARNRKNCSAGSTPTSKAAFRVSIRGRRRSRASRSISASPLMLTPGAVPPNIILRLVIGARFFSTIAMAGEQGDAALDAGIADALRAFDKAELDLIQMA